MSRSELSSLTQAARYKEKVKKLKGQCSGLREQLIQAQAVSAELRATASVAQSELQHWRSRVNEIEGEKTKEQVQLQPLGIRD